MIKKNGTKDWSIEISIKYFIFGSMFQYLSDQNGDTKAVLIPIKEWEAILEKHSDLRTFEQLGTTTDLLKPSDFKNIFTTEEGNEFRNYLVKARKEWDRNN